MAQDQSTENDMKRGVVKDFKKKRCDQDGHLGDQLTFYESSTLKIKNQLIKAKKVVYNNPFFINNVFYSKEKYFSSSKEAENFFCVGRFIGEIDF